MHPLNHDMFSTALLPAKILIVDDESLNIDYLEQELEDLGYQTVSATNGQEALVKVATEAPDLILLDVMMPILDGFAVCRILKENEETRFIPVVIMTALGEMEDRIKGTEAGADDFLTKPVDPRQLRARILTAIKMKQAVDRKFSELRQLKDHFAKFVPETVKRLAASPEASGLAEKREQDVSVLFVDISGYTHLSEELPLEQLDTLVQRYFSTFLDHINEAGGDICGIAGDGFMAIFQDTDPQKHVIKAVDTALALLHATEILNQENREHPLAIHLGLNCGVALVGSTRFEGVRGSRWTFTAIGPVSILASRLADCSTAGQFIVSPEAVRRLGTRYRLERIGCKRLKNITQPVDIYLVLGSSSQT
jgi:adenylate cyclase